MNKITGCESIEQDNLQKNVSLLSVSVELSGADAMTIWTFYMGRRNWWCKSGVFFSARLCIWRGCVRSPFPGEDAHHHHQRRSTLPHSVFQKLWLRSAQGNLRFHIFCYPLPFPNTTDTCRCPLNSPCPGALCVTRQGELCSTKFNFWVNLVMQHTALQIYLYLFH